MRGNPYTPGAGCTPMFLAGRENVLEDAQTSLEVLASRIPQRSCLFYGLRGVGKTVLLNAIGEFADNNDIHSVHIEATEKDIFISRLIGSINRFLREMSITESAKALRDQLVKLLYSFSLVYDLKDFSYSVELSPEEVIATGIVSDDLTSIFTALGKLAVNCNTGVVFLIDEIQLLEKEHLQPIITALHRCNQLRLPIMFFMAGLPKAIPTINSACSYAERLFSYYEIGELSCYEAEAAIVEPAKMRNVSYSPDAIQKIIGITRGYPYYIQEFCSTIWQDAEPCSQITLNHVEQSKEHFYKILDKGFFEARFSRCVGVEGKFVQAMASIGELPCAISDVAHLMNRTVQQISPTRATLLNKGIIYSPERGYVDFTVPLFDEYLKRNNTLDVD